jgi:hypothetical protein
LLRQRGRRVWLVHLSLLGVFALLAAITHALRADDPDVRVTSHLQRWHMVDGLMRAVSWVGSAPQVVPIDGVPILGLYALPAPPCCCCRSLAPGPWSGRSRC